MSEIKYENLDYGCYILDYELLGSYDESVKFVTADMTKLYAQKVRLPEGKGNIVYLVGKTLNDELNMIKNVQLPASYRRIFYPVWHAGTFAGRRFKFSVKDRKTRDTLISNKSNLVAYQVRRLPSSTNENIVFATDVIYTALEPVMKEIPASKLMTKFYPDFLSMLTNMSPEKPNDKKSDPASYNRILLIDCESFNFKPGATLTQNKTNPLYLLYLKFLRNIESYSIDMDVLVVSKNMFLKFNPSKLSMKKDWQSFRRGFFRIMNANLDDYTERLKEEEKAELGERSKDITVSNVVKTTVEPYVQNVSGSTKQVLTDAVEKKVRLSAANKLALDQEIKKATDVKPADSFTQSLSVLHTSPVKTPFNSEAEKLFKAVSGEYSALATDTGMEIDDETDEDFIQDYVDDIEDDAEEVLINDDDVKEEVLDEIQSKIVPLDHSTSPVNSERDRKLREKQKQVVVGNETIEQILERDSSNVPIQVEDKSHVMHTTNENMKQIKFANFDKTYIDELYMKDIVAAFDCLKDKEYPFYVTNVEVKDTSDSLNYKDTWTVTLVNELNKKSTVVVDIPKFQNDRFMLINGTRFIILKQNLYNPLVKDTPDTVILTTNFNKVTIERKSTKSLTDIEKIFSLIKKTKDSKMFMTGDSSKGNMKYISTLEYDELSKRLFRYTSDGCEIYFSRDYIKDNVNAPAGKGNEFFIGYENDKPIYIDEDTGLDRQGRTIIEIIRQHLPEEYASVYDSLKGPKQSMYVECTLAGQDIPVICALIVWDGIKKALDQMDIEWRFNESASRIPSSGNGKHHIRFSNGILEYESKTYADLIMNGLIKMHPERFQFEDFENETGYEEYLYSKWGSYNGINELNQFKQFLMDPITVQVCKDMMLPSTASGLMIHAAKLLSDNSHVSKASDTSYRIRSIEIIPAILYSCLADQYKAYVKSGGRVPLTLNKRCVLSRLMAEKTVEPYSTLNPVIEVTKTHTISTKGFKGSNSERSYDEEKRSYDPSAVGKIAISTDPNKNVGVNKVLTVEPTIANARGYREPVDEEELKDVNVFGPAELLTPGTIRNDDPIRSAIN